jgi:hypothetical protein
MHIKAFEKNISINIINKIIEYDIIFAYSSLFTIVETKNAIETIACPYEKNISKSI